MVPPVALTACKLVTPAQAEAAAQLWAVTAILPAGSEGTSRRRVAKNPIPPAALPETFQPALTFYGSWLFRGSSPTALRCSSGLSPLSEAVFLHLLPHFLDVFQSYCLHKIPASAPAPNMGPRTWVGAGWAHSRGSPPLKSMVLHRFTSEWDIKHS